MNTEHHHTFGELFKVFRLRSGIETLALFGNLMAEQGLIYENSLFSRWQRNERVPRDRKTLLAVIHICAEKGGITSTEEANLLLASADQRELTADEEMALDLVSRPSSSIDLNTQPATQPGPTLSFKQMLGLLFKSRVSYLIVALFVVQTFIFYAIWTENLYGTVESYVGGYLYGYIPIIATYFSLTQIRKNAISATSATSIKWLSYGVLAQVAGLQIWLYNNLKGIDVPYPSLADFGYFTLIPCYIYAAINITNATIATKIADFFKKKGFMVFVPALIGLASTIFYLSIRGVNISTHLADFFDIAYPIGETVPMTILVYALVVKMKSADTSSRVCAHIILLGFFLQFIAEYTFIFSARLHIYINSGFIDYLYCISYTYMALVIVLLTKINLLHAKNVATAKNIVAHPAKNSSRLLSNVFDIHN